MDGRSQRDCDFVRKGISSFFVLLMLLLSKVWHQESMSMTMSKKPTHS